MHYFIFDQFLNDKKYTTVINKIETRLTDLGINGRTEKLSILKRLPDTLNDIDKKGATTIVAVGNDHTISKIIGLLPAHDITLGIIPIGSENHIANRLGIPEGEAACEIIAARLIEKIDLGKANNYYFISHLDILSNEQITIDCGSYSVSTTETSNILSIRNFKSAKSDGEKDSSSNPKDGILEAVFNSEQKSQGFFNIFKKSYSKESIFPFKKIKIKCSTETIPALADGHLTIKTPIAVEVIPKKLKVIVGKNRMF